MRRSRLTARLIGERVALTLVCYVAVGAIVFHAAQTTFQRFFAERFVMIASLKANTVERELEEIRNHTRQMLAARYDIAALRKHFALTPGWDDLRITSLFLADLNEPEAALQVRGDTAWLPLVEYNLAIAIPREQVNEWLAAPTGLGQGVTAFLVSEAGCAGICRGQHEGKPHWLYYSDIAGMPFAVAIPTTTLNAPVQTLLLSWLLGSTILVGIVLVFIIYRSRQLAQPLDSLAQMAQATQLAIEQDLPLPTVDIESTGVTEIATLATTFEALIQQIRQFRQHNALAQSNLTTEIELRTAALSEAARLSQSLRVIIEKVRASLDENLILETAIDEISRALRPLVCNVALYDSSRQQVTVVYERGTLASGYLNRNLSMAKNTVYRYLLGSQSFQFCPLDAEGYGQAVAKLAVPIVEDNQVLGDIWVTRPASLTFLPSEQSLVSQVAAQCAIAIRQARLYHAAQDQVAVLARLNQLKDDFLSTVSHELRTPLTRLKMALQMIALSPEKFERYHPLAMVACNQQIALVDDLLSLQDLAVGCYSSAAEQVDLVDFIQVVVQHHEELITRQQQRLHLSIQPITVRLEPKPVRRIVSELVQNALKYSPPESEIGVQCFAQHDRWVCTVQNPGHIPEAEQERIFEKFYRIPRTDPWQHGGTGLGLALVQQLAQYLGGDIELRSDGRFVTVTISLPFVRTGAALPRDR